MTYKLGILTSHPIQYQAPLFRELARQTELTVFFAHRQTAQGQADAGFNVAFEWDVDLLGGYEYCFLNNRAKHPGVSDFFGCDTPEIGAEIRSRGFDAFLVAGWYLKSYWQAINACRRLGIPLMVRGDSQLGTPRGRLRQLGKKIIYPFLLRQFNACLYVGQKNREYLQYYDVPAERLFFSPHCVDNDWFAIRAAAVDRQITRSGLGIDPDVNVVLFAGKLIDRKRPMDMVLALRRLLDRGIKVCGVFAGDGMLKDKLKAQGDELGVPLIFLGFRNQSQLPADYAMADVMVLPSDGSETWGLVVNEALACGTPAVVSDAVGCAPDLVEEQCTGAVYPCGDIRALADALQRVLIAPPASESIRRKAEAYSVQAAAKGIIAAVNRSAGG